MHDIMKASFYRFRRTKDFFIAVWAAFLIGLSMGVGGFNSTDELQDTILGMGDNWMFMGFFITLFFIVAYIAGDFKNKTIYYEVMSGHRSLEIVVGRMIPVVIFSMIILFIEMAGLFGLGLLWGNWGSILGGPVECATRAVLLLFNILPFIGLCICITYLAKSIIGSLAVGWICIVLMQIPLVLKALQFKIPSVLYSVSIMVNTREILKIMPTFSFSLWIIFISLIKFFVLVMASVWLLNKSDLK